MRRLILFCTTSVVPGLFMALGLAAFLVIGVLHFAPLPAGAASILPGASLASATPTITPAPAVPTAAPYPDHGRAVTTRIAIPSLGIDLPIVSGDLRVNGESAEHFPLCDVGQYLTTWSQPGRPGTTYLYAHARTDMFLPLLTASKQADSVLLGTKIFVYTSDGLRYTYTLSVIRRHAQDFSLARTIFAGEQRLVLQTSEGPSSAYPKLQVGATLTAGPDSVSRAEAVPVAHPRPCT